MAAAIRRNDGAARRVESRDLRPRLCPTPSQRLTSCSCDTSVVNPLHLAELNRFERSSAVVEHRQPAGRFSILEIGRPAADRSDVRSAVIVSRPGRAIRSNRCERTLRHARSHRRPAVAKYRPAVPAAIDSVNNSHIWLRDGGFRARGRREPPSWSLERRATQGGRRTARASACGTVTNPAILVAVRAPLPGERNPFGVRGLERGPRSVPPDGESTGSRPTSFVTSGSNHVSVPSGWRSIRHAARPFELVTQVIVQARRDSVPPHGRRPKKNKKRWRRRAPGSIRSWAPAIPGPVKR
jgi:hypothetical protein